MLAGSGIAHARAGALDRRISIDLAQAPVKDLFHAFAEELGAELRLDPALAGSVSLRLDNVKISTALDAACDSVGCTYQHVSGRSPRLHVLASRTEEARGRGLATESPLSDRARSPVSVSLRDAALGDVMGSFARILRCELRLDADPSIALTVELENVLAEEALARIDLLLGLESAIRTTEEGACELVVRSLGR
jgi:hypothetical protein